MGGKFLYVWVTTICWALWRTRNDVHFEKEKKKIGSPAESLFSLSFYFLYWAELQPEGDRKKLEDGAMVLKEVAPLAELSGDQRGSWPLWLNAISTK